MTGEEGAGKANVAGLKDSIMGECMIWVSLGS